MYVYLGKKFVYLNLEKLRILWFIESGGSFFFLILLRFFIGIRDFFILVSIFLFLVVECNLLIDYLVIVLIN